jgi:pimeloyl-ACP methyl ester carboxylesterase
VDNKNAYCQAGIESLPMEVNGRRIRYLKAGGGPAVVLMHGGASDSRDWIHTMTALADRFSLYAPDIIGFGESDRDEKGYYLSDFTDFLTGFIDALKLQCPALVGHSFGARVCLEVAHRHQEKINKLVLIDASGLGEIAPLGRVLFDGFTVLRKLLRKRQPFPKFLAKEGEDYNDIGGEALKSLRMPTLLIWKSRDPYIPVSQARRAEKLIPGAKLVVLDGYGHAPHQHENEEFNRILQNFLDGAVLKS